METFSRRLALLAAILAMPIGPIVAGPIDESEAIVVRFVQPDHQAAEVMRLFQHARWDSPAAVAAAWKRSAPASAQLSKPAEAVIAVFNREMAGEWHALDGTELRAGIDARTGAFAWAVTIPHDDGTVAAAITAMRLSYPEDQAIESAGHRWPVARLGRPGLPLACQDGPLIVVASSRELLGHAMEQAHTAPPSPRQPASSPSAMTSGTHFVITPDRFTASGKAPLWERRVVTAVRESGCRRVEGMASLDHSTLRLDVTSRFDEEDAGAGASARTSPRAIDLRWLEEVPSANLAAALVLAIDPDPRGWDRAWALADRVDRADPSRAAAAPLRSRLNLLAAAAGIQLEADLRPHLRGLTAWANVDPAHPGGVLGAVVTLHLDDGAVAERIVRQAVPRIKRLLGGNADQGGLGRDQDPAARPANGGPDDPPCIGMVARRQLRVEARGRSIRVSWGDVPLSTGPGRPPFAAGFSNGPQTIPMAGAEALPSRVILLWPGRIAQLVDGSRQPSLAERILADDPGVVWRGWSERGHERDLLTWSGLDERVRKFLDALPLAEPVAAPPARP